MRHKLAQRVSGVRNFAPLFLYLLRRFIRAGICFRFGSYTQSSNGKNVHSLVSFRCSVERARRCCYNQFVKNLKLAGASRIILVRTKVERAKHHLRSLEEQLEPYRDKTQPVYVRSEMDLVALPLLSFNILTTAGDVIHNLRTALDHLAHQLVLVGTPDGNPPRQIEFPILESEEEYEKRKASKTRGMRADAVQAIDELKPYKEGNPILWRLRELDNIDKHRMILSVGEECLLEDDWVGWAPYLLKAHEPHFEDVGDSNETDLKSSELLGDSEIIGGNRLQPTLREMATYVEYIVGKFHPLLEPTQILTKSVAN